jgi:hypothetical protein
MALDSATDSLVGNSSSRVKPRKGVERSYRKGERARQDFVSDWKAERIPHRASANTKQARRYSADAWHCLRGVIDREHRTVATADPHSPRIRPTLPSFTLDEGSER